MSKRMKNAYAQMQTEGMIGQSVSIEKAITLLKSLPQPKFGGALEIVIKLGIDATKSDQAVRGAALMPSGMGKNVKVAVFAQGNYQKEAQAAGADYIIGDEENAKDFVNGNLDINACVATPDLMSTLLKWGVSKILGPKGLMPNAKVGTVTFDVKNIVNALKKGQATFKNDKAGYLHASVGLLSFSVEDLKDNVLAFVASVLSAKPAAVKSNFVQSVTLSSTMCPSLTLNMSEFSHFSND